MRVLVVSSMYPTEEHPIGGIFVHEQVKALRAAGIDARVVSGKPFWLSGRHPVRALYRYLRLSQKAWPGWSSYDGVPVCYFGFPAGAFSRKSVYSYFYSIALGHWLKALRRDFDYQLVHAHTAYLDGRAGARAARTARVPYVLTEHTGPLSSVTDKWSMRRQAQYGIDAADLIVTVSSALRSDLMRQLRVRAPDRVVVVPNGVDTDFFVEQEQSNQLSGLFGNGATIDFPDVDVKEYLAAFLTQLSLRPGLPLTTDLVLDAHKTVAAAFRAAGDMPSDDHQSQADERVTPINAIWVGHHVDVKRVDRLLHAFAIAHRRESRLRLTLLGDGPLLEPSKQLARALKIEPYVTFLPGTSRSGVREKMVRADFLVISSETETFGVVGIEALSIGLPVLATACGGPADFIRHRGLGELVGNTSEDLAIGLQVMADRLPEFDRMAIRQYAIENYDYTRVAQRLMLAYEALLQPEHGTEAMIAVGGKV